MKIDFKDIPKTSKLFLDYLYDFDKVREFYNFAPFEMVEFTIQFEKLKSREYQRDKIAEILTEQNKKYGASQETLQSIEKIKDKNTFVVFTGQQIGLFGGPLYTLYKALTAINLSLHLSRHTPYTVLPFFWVEGEDHDFEEIRSAYITGKNNELVELRYEPNEPFDGRPVGGMVLDETITALIDKYEASVHKTDFSESTINALRECYKPGRTLADAFASWLTYLMGHLGLILVDPSDKRFKEMALPVYEASLEKHRNEINNELTRVNRSLMELGYHNQVGHRMDTLDFFYHDPRRLPFVREEERFYLKDSDLNFSKDELLQFIRENVADFSPNVMLRPQVQDYIFPNAAYVAGPSEIAYYAQFKGIYEIFGTPMPVIYPRRSITILENKVQSIFEKYNIKFTDVFTEKRDLEMKIIRDNYPQSLSDTIEDTKKLVASQLEKLEKEAGDFNANLTPVIKRLEGRIAKEMQSTETRLAHEMEKRDNIMKSHVDKLFVNIYPDNHLQERLLSVLNFLYKYDLKFVDAVRCISCLEHEAFHSVWEARFDCVSCKSCFSAEDGE